MVRNTRFANKRKHAILIERMNTDEKILHALAALQADVTALKTEHGKRFEGIEKTQEQQGKILAKVGNDLATVLSEQQQQRTDMRYFHEDLDRIERKIDRVASDVKSHKERIENLEEHTGTPNPHKH